MSQPMSNPPPTGSMGEPPMAVDGSAEDAVLSASTHLSRQQVLSRRSRRAKQLAKIYRAHYWALMEEVRSQYKAYYWKYGMSPFERDHRSNGNNNNNNNNNNKTTTTTTIEKEEDAAEFEDDNDDANKTQGGGRAEGGFIKCAAGDCPTKAMPLTPYCHLHILADPKQKLYKGCTFVTRSLPRHRVLCGKPVLRSSVPAHCPFHSQRAEGFLVRALRKAGLNASSSSTLAPKLHVVVAEFVRQIQTKRRAALKENLTTLQMKEDGTS